MIGPGSDAKVLIYTRPVDFRCGIDTLVAKVQHELHMSPWAGVVFVFRSKRKDRLKILWADGTGVWLMTKRAESEQGFAWPQPSDGVFRITAAQMAALVSGMDWRRHRAPRRVIGPKVEACASA
ncbi:IS66 family insertion sequence element accessory protein TnpB [Sphingobium sp.]|jgi:transposase|uniref:IS66 family insertion sequence element accessory protein TnpB n=1 Tax=Sphingobium sp. TaxID=1912891 RepID=UPI002C141E31|nr:IS66 family insertion sequence element accessory protein TnpB [Sphingobium sp.]HUD92944.1 IS66 family insertion sequence element accessory protein TnpB [Sphingobium sp.]